jgi:hypothetical protein
MIDVYGLFTCAGLCCFAVILGMGLAAYVDQRRQ